MAGSVRCYDGLQAVSRALPNDDIDHGALKIPNVKISLKVFAMRTPHGKTGEAKGMVPLAGCFLFLFFWGIFFFGKHAVAEALLTPCQDIWCGVNSLCNTYRGVCMNCLIVLVALHCPYSAFFLVDLIAVAGPVYAHCLAKSVSVPHNRQRGTCMQSRKFGQATHGIEIGDRFFRATDHL